MKVTSRKGFTLIELLVVIAIIAVLLSILVPALSAAKAQAKAVLCATHLRNLSVGLRYYCDENKDRVMPLTHASGDYWFYKIAPYMGAQGYESDPEIYMNGVMKAMICPMAPTPTDPAGNCLGTATTAWREGYVADQESHAQGSYGMNLWMQPRGLFTDGPGAVYLQNYMDNFYYKFSMAPGGETPLYGDANWVGSWPDSHDITPADGLYDVEKGGGWSPDAWHTYGHMMGHWVIDRHNGAVNIVFTDGHVNRIELPDLWKLKWHKNYVPAGNVDF
ncbi:MAG: prepilin-type N-terminal cleavage/methylation domain-containing protein [Sedimentisphaerales bacterium]|nr:prepilin-type N-terminal cleavage/methylation domain-containing protein [Sedimentisphaerales bacterium]